MTRWGHLAKRLLKFVVHGFYLQLWRKVSGCNVCHRAVLLSVNAAWRLLAQICAISGWDCLLLWLLCVFRVINYCQSILKACRDFQVWDFFPSYCLWRWRWTMLGCVSQQDGSKEKSVRPDFVFLVRLGYNSAHTYITELMQKTDEQSLSIDEVEYPTLWLYLKKKNCKSTQGNYFVSALNHCKVS